MLAELADEVHTIERIPELAAQARENLAASGHENVHVHVGDGRSAFRTRLRSPRSPWRRPHRRCRSGSTTSSSQRGRLVVPLGGRWGQRLEVIVRSPEGPAVIHSVPCRFVPLVGEQGFDE